MNQSKKHLISLGIYSMLFTGLMFTYNNCSRNSSFTADPSFSESETISDAQSKNCEFNGRSVADGATVQAYLVSAVDFGHTCTPQARTCSNGQLSGNHQFATCAVGVAKSCLFNGQTIAHGASVTSFLNSSVPFGSSCQQETRTCNNGALSGSSSYATCAVGAGKSCLFNGLTIPHGSNVNAYLDSSVPFGTSCKLETRTCNNGNLSGAYQFSACAIDAAKSCLFNGLTIPHGGEVKAYVQSSVPYGYSCVSADRICNNGVLNGTNQYASCVVNQPSSCLFNGVQVLHGSSTKAYKDATVPHGSTCLSQDRICSNGTLSGIYSNSTCVVAAPTIINFEIPITQNVTYAPYKLLIVVDNSYTMSQSQAKLASVINSLVQPFAGKDLQIKVITTTDATGYWQNGTKILIENATTSYVDQLLDWNSNSVLSSEQISVQSNGYTYKRKRTYGFNEGKIFRLSSADSSTVITNTVNNLKSYITSVGTSGNNNEQFFCPFVREFMADIASNRFLKNGDRAGVILISDEDDHSDYAKCIADSTVKMTHSITPDKFSFNSGNLRLWYEFDYEYDEVRDGVTTHQKHFISFPVVNVPKSEYQFSQLLSNNECNNSLKTNLATKYLVQAQNYASSYKSNEKNYKYTNLKLSKCVYENNNSWIYAGPTLGNLGSKTPNSFGLPAGTDLCTVTNYNSSGLSIGKYYESQDPTGYYSSCIKQPGFSTEISDSSFQSTTPVISASSDIDFADKVISNAKNYFASGQFFVNFITYPTSGLNSNGQPCSLSSGQSAGSRYQTIAAKYSDIAKVYPICDSDFTQSMNKISENMILTSKTVYSIGTIDRTHVTEVNLVRNGVTTKLNSTQYDFNTTGKISLNISLEANDKIVIKYY